MIRSITNTEKLATTSARRDTLRILEAGLAAIDTSTVLEEKVSVDGATLRVDGHQYALDEYEHIFIIGFGKVTCDAAKVLESKLSGVVSDGAVIGVREQVCEVVDTYAGTHPTPSHYNYTATKHITEIARKAKENDLVIVIVSGGGSALLCSSLFECDESTALYEAFKKTGGTIDELNTVRKHLSTLKGGGLARELFPAEVLGLVFSDIPGGDLAAVASGPTFYDESTKEDAAAIIDYYKLGSFTLSETPKEKWYFTRVTNVPIVTNATALHGMADTATALGYTASVVRDDAYLMPEEVCQTLQNAAAPGHVALMGGETRYSIPEGCEGEGGRNDTLALAVLPSLTEGQVFAALASDGHDNGSTAGAIVDRETMEGANARRLDPTAHVAACNAVPFFSEIEGHITTRPLSSNVADLMVLLTQWE